MSRAERQPPISKRNSYNGPRCCEGVEEKDTLECHPLEDDEDRSASCASRRWASPFALCAGLRVSALGFAEDEDRSALGFALSSSSHSLRFLLLDHAPFGVMHASGPPQHW